jgi:hypothetical protein
MVPVLNRRQWEIQGNYWCTLGLIFESRPDSKANAVHIAFQRLTGLLNLALVLSNNLSHLAPSPSAHVGNVPCCWVGLPGLEKKMGCYQSFWIPSGRPRGLNNSIKPSKPGAVAQSYKPRTWEEEGGGLGVSPILATYWSPVSTKQSRTEQKVLSRFFLLLRLYFWARL